MKKKIILALMVCLFAAGSIINIHLAQNNHNTDISLADISVMAQADVESGRERCHAGGPGAINCNIGTTVLGVEYYCETTCEEGFYACCNLVADIPPVICPCKPY